MTQALVQRLADIPVEPESLEMLKEHLKQREFTVVEETDTTQPDETELLDAIQLLKKHQHILTPEVRLPLIQDILSGEYNAGIVTLKSDLDLMRRRNPAALKVFWMVLDAVCMQEGLRVIRDQPIQEYAGREKARSKVPAWKRWLRERILDEQQKTAQLIQEAVQLAADNDSLKKENAHLRAQNEGLAKQNKETLESMAIEARKMIEAANTEARNLISATRDSLFQENKRVKELQIIAEELAKNPEIKNVYAKKQETRFDILAEQIFIQGQRFIGSSRKFEREEDFLRALSSMSNHLRSFDKNILGVLEDIEIQFGLEKRNLVVYRLRQKLTGTIQADFLIQYFSGYFPQGMDVNKNYQSARIREFTFSNSFLKILDMLTANHPLATVRLQLHALIKYLDTEVPAQAENLIIDKEVYRYPFRANSDDSLYIRQKAEARHTVIEKITSLLNDITEATKTP